MCKLMEKIAHESGDAFRAYVELYTPTGCFVKYRDETTPQVIKSDGGALQIGGIYMSHNLFSGWQYRHLAKKRW